MDNLTLQVLLQELKPDILQKSIQKIKLTADGTLIFSLRSEETQFLVTSFQSSYPCLFLSGEDPSSELTVTDGLLALRKYLVSGKIVNARKELADRIIFLDIENYGLSYQAKKFTLVLELIPAKPDALLLDETQEIISSLLALQEHSRRDQNLYQPPQSKSDLTIDRITKQEFQQLVHSSAFSAQEARTKAPAIPSQLRGISPVFFREILFEVTDDLDVLWGRFQRLLDRIRNGPYSPRLYFLDRPLQSSQPGKVTPPKSTGAHHAHIGAPPPMKIDSPLEGGGRRQPAGDVSIASGTAPLTGTPPAPAALPPLLGGIFTGAVDKLVVTPFPLASLNSFQYQEFPSMNAACLEFYRLSRTRTAFLHLHQSLILKALSSLKKKTRLWEHLQADLKKYQDFEIYKKYADLLYAQKDRSLPGQSILRIPDLFDPNQSEIAIPLDPKLSLIQNANRYSKLYQKANRAIPQITRKLKALEAEIAVLQSHKENLANAEKMEDLDKAVEENEQQLALSAQSRPTSALVRSHKGSAHSPAASQSLLRKSAKRFLSSDGLEILVGKSNKDNDRLTLQIAKKEDFWFHVAGYGGSHVVLRNPEKLTTPPRQSLLEAAQLAAYFSQARNAPKVEVHYTQKRFVSKPKGAKPGLVRLREYKSVSVRPQLLTESDNP